MEQAPKISNQEKIDDIVEVLAAEDPNTVDTSKYAEERGESYESSNKATEPSYQGNDEVKTKPVDLPKLHNYDQATPQHVQAVAKEFFSSLDKIEHLYQTNQISHEQYQQAVYNAGEMAKEIKQMEISARQNVVRAKEFEQQFHTQTAELVPGWENLNKRESIVKGINNLCSKYGITEQELAQYQSSPKIVAMMADLVKKTSPKPNIPNRVKSQQFKRDTNQRPSMPLSTNRRAGGDIDAIADLLVKNGVR